MKRPSEGSGTAQPGARSTWHYGLIATWWDEILQGGPEIACVRRFIQTYGEPVLDVGCGTGRVLLQTKLPEPPLGPSNEAPRAISDGSALRLRARVLAFDPDGPALTHEMVAERFVGGHLERSEVGILHENLYTPNELALMLEHVGFSRVSVECDHSASSATPDGTVHTFIARRDA